MNALLRVIGALFAIIASGILATVLVVWVYSALVASGRPASAYQAFAQTAGPWISITVGPVITYFFVALAIRGLEPKLARRVGIAIMLIYVGLDAALLASTSTAGGVWTLACISALARCFATCLAVRRYQLRFGDRWSGAPLTRAAVD